MNASDARTGFYNELMALGDVVANAQAQVEDGPSVWSDPEIQTGLSITDPDDVQYSVAEAEAAYTRTYDRMLVMLKAALRRTLAQGRTANAADARDFQRTGVE